MSGTTLGSTLIEELEQAAEETVCFCEQDPGIPDPVPKPPCAQCQFRDRLRARAEFAQRIQRQHEADPSDICDTCMLLGLPSPRRTA